MQRFSLIAVLLLCAGAAFGQSVVSLPPGIDGHFVRLTSQIPGFGGYFFDAQGDLNVYVTDESHGGLARAVLADVARNRPDRLEHPWTRPAEIIVRKGTFDFVQLDGFHHRLTKALPRVGVTMVDTDEAANKVFVGVANTSAADAVLAAADAAGIPREALDVEVVKTPELATTLTDEVRPLVAGLGIDWTYNNFQSSCTIGVNVLYANSSIGLPSATPGFYTASHCSAAPGSSNHQRFFQGTTGVASEYYDPPMFTNAQNYTCAVGWNCRYSDTLYAMYDTGVSRSQGVVATTTVRGVGPGVSGSTTISGSLTYNSILPYPTVGQYLDKVGRTTGWTEGAVIHTCTDYYGINAGVGILCNDEVASTANFGDSGSGVFQLSGLNVSFAGILWAKTTSTSPASSYIFSNTNRIAADFGGTVNYTGY